MVLEKIYSLLISMLMVFGGILVFIIGISILILPIIIIIYSIYLASKFLDNYLSNYSTSSINEKLTSELNSDSKFLIKYGILFLYSIIISFLCFSSFGFFYLFFICFFNYKLKKQIKSFKEHSKKE